MGSSGSPGTWAPYDTYRDCSRGICSIYCPQWCYIVFPPPPPPPAGFDVSSGTTFSPLIIAVIGILASAFLLVSYYTIVTKYCRRRGSRNAQIDFGAHHGEVYQDQWQVATVGLDETIIKSITIFKYRKSDKLVEGTECAVCLNEFLEEENLRLLPKCCHAFHPPCIDTWLKSQSNCPLCRASVNPFSPITPNSQTPVTINVSSLEVERENDLVFVVEDDNQVREVSVCDDLPKDPVRDAIEMENSVVSQFRRSISLGTLSCERNLLVADIIRSDQDNSGGCNLEGVSRSGVGIGSSKDGVRRSFSTGRFDFTWHDDRGKMHILPN